MRFNIFISILLVFGLIACDTEQVYLIPEDEMIEILADIHTADGLLNTMSYPYEIVELRPENFYNNVLYKYEIDRVIFDSALSQYAQNRTLYISMYEKVIENLRIKESLIEAGNSDSTGISSPTNMFFFSYSTGYENDKALTEKIKGNITNSEAHKGKKSYFVKKEKFIQRYSTVLKDPVQEFEFIYKGFVKFSKVTGKYPSLYLGIEKDGKALSSQYIKLDTFINNQFGWNEINTKAKLSLKSPESDVKIVFYMFNSQKAQFCLDDYFLSIKQLK